MTENSDSREKGVTARKSLLAEVAARRYAQLMELMPQKLEQLEQGVTELLASGRPAAAQQLLVAHKRALAEIPGAAGTLQRIDYLIDQVIIMRLSS